MRLILLMASSLLAYSQTQTFEVASIRPAQASSRTAITTSGSRFRAENVTAKGLVMYGYHLRVDEVVVPESLAAIDLAYDVTAKAEGDRVPSTDEFRQMVRSLVVDRFKLKAHRDMREIPVYILTTERAGPKFKSSPNDDHFDGAQWTNGRNQIIALTKGSMADFAGLLQQLVDRPVVDKTNLTGKYNIRMEATPERLMNSDPADGHDISVFTAVRLQLGLRLEAAKDRTEVLVVDQVSKPTEN